MLWPLSNRNSWWAKSPHWVLPRTKCPANTTGPSFRSSVSSATSFSQFSQTDASRLRTNRFDQPVVINGKRCLWHHLTTETGWDQWKGRSPVPLRWPVESGYHQNCTCDMRKPQRPATLPVSQCSFQRYQSRQVSGPFTKTDCVVFLIFFHFKGYFFALENHVCW